MRVKISCVSAFILVVTCSVPAFADDCAVTWSAMMNTGHTPHSVTVTKTAAQGKKVMTRQVQTVTNKYVQTENGKWYAMGIAMKDLDDTRPTTMTCHRDGSESVHGESTTIYQVHMENEGTVSEGKFWVSSRNLVLKSDVLVEGVPYTSEYDFANVTPPANAVTLGGK